jgi:hypothetical protein
VWTQWFKRLKFYFQKEEQTLMDINTIISNLLQLGNTAEASTFIKDVKAVITLFESNAKLKAVEAIVNGIPQNGDAAAVLANQIKQAIQ